MPPEPLPPSQLAETYRFPPGATGAGHTIVLLEFGGGFHAEDLQEHLESTGINSADVLPIDVDELGRLNEPLSRKRLTGILRDWNTPGTTFDELRASHSDFDKFLATLEVTADIQLVRALAPGAKVVVLFGDLGPSVGSVVQFALEHHDPTVIATSWGTSEWRRSFIEVLALERHLKAARDRQVTVCCASGDFGSLNDPPEFRTASAPSGKTRVNWPASCPLALACGGSELRFDGNPEVVWETSFGGLRRASGGGMSGRYRKPAWQQGIAPHEPSPSAWTANGGAFDGRWLPDVSAHAGRTYRVRIGGEDTLVDGTSMAAPLWAALLACISEKLGRKVGWVNERLYSMTSEQHRRAFNDVTAGSNEMPDVPEGSFRSGAGWDPCTGLGSPKGIELMEALR